MRTARIVASASERAQLRSARIMPRYVEGTAPTSPREGGLGGDPCRAGFARHSTPERRGACASFASRVTGGAGAPARGLRSAGCTTRRPPTQHSTWPRLAVACRAPTRYGVSEAAQRQRPPMQPGARVAGLFATRVTGGPKARSATHRVGTSCQVLSSASTSSPSSSASAAKADNSSSAVGAASSSQFIFFVRVAFAGCVSVCTSFSFLMLTWV